MTDKEILKALGLSKKSCLSEMIVQTTHHWLDACEKVDELEKENAELKEAIKHFNPCCEWDNDVHDCEFRHYAMEYGSNLTKAKELLKMALDWQCRCGNGHPTWQEVCAKIEQFLNEDSTYERIQKAKYNYVD